MATYFIDVNNFSMATAVWTDSILTIKAPDGYYSTTGNYREQVGGFLGPLLACAYVATESVTGIGQTTATFYGELVSNGGDVTATRGFVYGTSPNPTTANNVLTDTAVGQGVYSLNATGLTPGTTYYVKSYAVVFGIIIYGAQLSFGTQSVISYPIDLCYDQTSSQLACDCSGCANPYNGYLVTNPNAFNVIVYYHDENGILQNAIAQPGGPTTWCSIGVPFSNDQITVVFESCDCLQ